MKNNEIKEMTTEKRRNFLLHKVQFNGIMVLWSIRDNDPEVMMYVQLYRISYNIYRNIKRMIGEATYKSPRVDLNIQYGNWEHF